MLQTQMTGQEFLKRLGEIRCIMHSPEKRADPDCRKGVREWITATEGSRASEHRQWYRVYGEDLDGDILHAASCFAPDARYQKQEACYDLRRLWRILLRNYAFSEALQLDAALRRLESPGWWFWRWKDLLMWRVIIGLAIGYLLLWSSSGLLDFVRYAHGNPGWTVGLVVVSLISAFAIALTEVERRIGRRPLPVIASRVMVIVSLSLLYAALGGWFIYVAGSCFPAAYEPSAAKSTMVSAIALALGFLFQLFWEESSFGEPL